MMVLGRYLLLEGVSGEQRWVLLVGVLIMRALYPTAWFVSSLLTPKKNASTLARLALDSSVTLVLLLPRDL